MSAELFGFHSQQAIEKMLKALLAALAVHFPKTHNLQALVEILEAHSLRIPPAIGERDRLTPYATVYRYENLPEHVALDRNATRSLVREVRVFVEQQLASFPVPPPRTGLGPNTD